MKETTEKLQAIVNKLNDYQLAKEKSYQYYRDIDRKEADKLFTMVVTAQYAIGLIKEQFPEVEIKTLAQLLKENKEK